MATPTSRTLQLLKGQGYIVDVCERWMRAPSHPGGGVRKDLFGFLDLVAIQGCIVGIQCTSYAGRKPHKDKIEAIPAAQEWMNAGAMLVLVTWKKERKRKADGTKGAAMIWTARAESASLRGNEFVWSETVL